MSTFSTGKAAAYLGVGVKTLQRWDREGRLKPERTSTGRRAYTKAALDVVLNRVPQQAARIPVAYCRVSSAAQKPDLKNQRRVLEDFCAARGVANVEFVEEVGGGLNLKRKKFVALMGSDRGTTGVSPHHCAQRSARQVWLLLVRAVLCRARHRVVGAQQRAIIAGTGNGSGLADNRALLFGTTLRTSQLP